MQNTQVIANFLAPRVRFDLYFDPHGHLVPEVIARHGSGVNDFRCWPLDGGPRADVLQSVFDHDSLPGYGRAHRYNSGEVLRANHSEMKRRERGKAQENILNWMTILHGYLSSPTGGGVRHGTDLKEGIAIQPHEARLYCNLARSYLTFLLEEHDQQSNRATSMLGSNDWM
ncbi:hypothetical protein [Pseudomonas viridiflava]|uniref:hypothetical protein n=1 Tax=Pseudomonas syringae group TaxID=136849 RepID=UPI001980AEED|nr:hypothetical protein [Pseudomonas viridiflava]